MTWLAYGALWIFVFVLPWERITASSGVSMLSRGTGVLALGLALLAVLISGRIRRLHLFHVAALLFVIWAGVGLFGTPLLEIPPKFYTFVQLLLVVWMVWELASSKQRLFGLLTAYVFGAYVSALGTIMVYRSAGGALRRYSVAGDANDLAATLALALPMAWYLGMTYHRPLLRWLCRGYLPVGLLAIGLSGSRGGMLASVVALTIVPLTMARLSPSRLAAGLAILCVSGALAVAIVPDKVVQRLATTATEVEDANLGGRFRIWKAGVSAFALKPLTGYGTGRFKKAVWPFGVGQVAHNSYLSLLVEQGAIGFLFYSMMLGAVFLALLQLPVLERRFGLVVLATLGTAMLPLTWEDNKVVWFVLAALLGLSKVHFAEPHAPGGQFLAGRSVLPPRPRVVARPLAAPGGRRAGPDART
jgi:O-antigen ligase